MKFIVKIAGLLSIMSILFACSDKSTDGGSQSEKSILYQVTGCRGNGFAKSSASDSCFSFQFSQDLLVDFCVSANCCPDSNRFLLTSRISNDTITVTVADTAAHLCRCTCSYTIHAEFSDLPRNHYLFLCLREDYSDKNIIYSEDIYGQ